MTYPAKLLLLGEYTVLNCSHALAQPYAVFSGTWSRDHSGPDLKAFLNYLRTAELVKASGLELDLDRFAHELDEGLVFASDIPAGYGLGSSGALCAGVYDRFARNKIDPGDLASYADLQTQLASMESFFHGSSSATDPMVSYIKRPILLLRDAKPEPVFLPEAGEALSFFLLDTGIRRQTGPFVRHFMEKCRDPRYANAVETRLGPVNNMAIQAWLAGDWEALYAHWSEIAALEFQYLAGMIPKAFKELWENSLHGQTFKLKLCGAGGGGFLLGVTRDGYLTRQLLDEWPLRML